MNVIVTNKEYDKLIEKLIFFDTMRNNLLTFSFTAVLAMLGVAITTKNINTFIAWMCLIPFCLIIPFSARISYYRLVSAHINSFLKKFAPDKMQFEIGTTEVRENNCKFYPLIAWLVNHEMLLLSIATSCTFYIKYIVSISVWKCYNYFSLVIPIILCIVVFLISHSTYSYKNLMKDFEKKWISYSESR